MHEDLCRSDHFSVILTSNAVEEDARLTVEFEKGRMAVLPSSVSFWTTREEVMSAGDPVGEFTDLLIQTAVLLSCVGKVLQRCVHRHIYRFLMLNNMITPSQSGFATDEPTTDQLLCICENLCSNFDKRITTHSVYFDISNAFDRVWHKGFLLELESIGVRGKLV